MQESCKQCSASFDVTPFHLELIAKLAPTMGGKRWDLPAPSLCPDCRQQRRLLWRNERVLYRRPCDQCRKSLVSMYPTGTPFPVYCNECWWSDAWDPLQFGRDVDFSRPFFPQFKELQNVVPRPALNVVNNENSDFVNHSGSNKNCYLIFAAEFNEDCLYGYQVIKSSDCVDTSDCTESELCYEVSDVNKCHSLSYSNHCTNCSASAFLYDCIGCNDCLFCSNLRNKRFWVRNKPCSQEDYEKEKRMIMERLARGGAEALLQEFAAFTELSLHRASDIVNCENVTGDTLKNSRNLQHCFELSYAEDCAYVYTGFQTRDLVDVCHTTDAQLGYDSLSLGYGSYNALFTHGSWGSKNVLYCDIVQTGSDLFGCVCTKPAKHCILNKQYTKEEYERLAAKLIAHMQETGEWGEFFPAGISPFAYNETTAQQYFPLRKQEVSNHGWPWQDREPEPPEVTRVIPADKLPRSIDDVPDDILSWAIQPSEGRPFKIVRKELEFYRSHRLPVPRHHPDARHLRRMLLRNPRKLWQRTCMECQKPISTTYAPNRPERVVCEACYMKNVY